MSSKTTTSPDVSFDEPTTAATPADPGVDPATTGDELPFESPEFGVSGFFPHLGSPTDD